jgi:hypothetical protein
MKRTRGCTAVALALTALLLTSCGADSEGKATPGAGGDQTLLGPGDEADGMRLTTATEADTKIFGTFCDPIIVKPATTGQPLRARAASPADAAAGTMDATWTFTVVRSPDTR